MVGEGVFPKSDGDILYASEVNSFEGSRKILGFGTITVQTTSTAYDTDYVDFAFSAGDLNATDQLVVDFAWQNGFNSAGNVFLKCDVLNTTATGSTAELSIASNGSGNAGNCIGTTVLRQNQSTTDIVNHFTQSHSHTTSSGMSVQSGTIDTNDANIFATAWTLRINTKVSGSVGGNTSLFYRVYRDVLPQ